MRFRSLLCAMVVVLSGASGCATQPQTTAPTPRPTAIPDPAKVPGLPTVLVVMPASETALAVRSGLLSELKGELNVATLAVTPATTAADLAAAVDRENAACVVIMNNPTVKLFREFRASRPSGAASPPGIIVLTSFVEDIAKTLDNVVGISYEVPAVVAFGRLRALLSKPVNKVGVVYRPALKAFIERHSKLAKREKFSIVAEVVPAQPTAEDVRAAAQKLREAQVDAVWVLNDNSLVAGDFIGEGWAPVIGDGQLPVIVGVGTLVSAEAPFGTLAVVPDLEAMGVQAGTRILDLRDARFRIKERAIDLPIATKLFVDIKRARQIGIREEEVPKIDRIVE